MNPERGLRDPWEEICAVARVISPFIDAADCGPVLQSADAMPSRVIDRAAEMNVLPAFAFAVAQKGLNPAFTQVENDVLEAGYRLNVMTNQRLCAEAARISRPLAAAGVTFAFLKGTARILRDHQVAPGRRTTGDIDLLVAPEQAETTQGVLGTELAYEAVHVEPVGRHAWGYLQGGEGGPTLDLHIRPGPQTDLLSTAKALADRIDLDVAGARVPVIGATHWILHAIFHAQIQDRHHARAYPGLRAHEDLAWARATLGAADWEAVGARLARSGYGAVYRDTCALNDALFQHPHDRSRALPAGIHVRRVAATVRHERLRRLTDTAVATLHVLHRAAVCDRYPNHPLWIGRLRVVASAIRRHGLNAPNKIRFLVSRYRSVHGP